MPLGLLARRGGSSAAMGAAGLEFVFTLYLSEDVEATAKAIERDTVYQLKFQGFLHWYCGKRQPGRWRLL